MKSVQITGKHNKEQLIYRDTGEKVVRSNANYNEPSHLDQVSLVNKYYMGHSDTMETHMKREIARKISGYKSQDMKKKIFDQAKIITLSNVLEKLVVSKLHCVYCKNEVKVLFTSVRDERQWTLDRLDNNLCHSESNTVICCLKCNLERRVMGVDKFTFTKQLKIKKLD